MPRSHGQANIAEGGKLLANRALVHRNAERLFDAPLQIDAAPANNAVLFRVETLLDPSGELRPLLV